MRITMNLPDKLLAELHAATGETNRTLLIRTALEEKLKRAKRDQILKLRGKVPLDVDLSDFRGRDLL
jgi:metal-responsive CopG/Arc/MetJ family transcriptional regulator